MRRPRSVSPAPGITASNANTGNKPKPLSQSALGRSRMDENSQPPLQTGNNNNKSVSPTPAAGGATSIIKKDPQQQSPPPAPVLVPSILVTHEAATLIAKMSESTEVYRGISAQVEAAVALGVMRGEPEAMIVAQCKRILEQNPVVELGELKL